MALELKAPVVPIAISGAYRALPRGKRLPRFFTRVTVRFLPPIPAAEHTDEHKLADAARAGSTYIVVGRPILQAADPAAAARSILAELG